MLISILSIRTERNRTKMAKSKLLQNKGVHMGIAIKPVKELCGVFKELKSL
jgi:hypothetical protein